MALQSSTRRFEACLKSWDIDSWTDFFDGKMNALESSTFTTLYEPPNEPLQQPATLVYNRNNILDFAIRTVYSTLFHNYDAIVLGLRPIDRST